MPPSEPKDVPPTDRSSGIIDELEFALDRMLQADDDLARAAAEAEKADTAGSQTGGGARKEQPSDAPTGTSQIDTASDDEAATLDAASADAPGDYAMIGDSALEQKIAALEQLVSQRGDDWDTDPDDLGPPMFQRNPVRELDWKARDISQKTDTSTTEPAEGLMRVEDDADMADVATDTAPESPETVDTLEAPEADTADSAAGWADAPSKDTSQSTVTPFVLHAAPEPDDLPAKAPVAEDERVDLVAETSLPLDEEALRDLVSEMVRRELQGALGERITRNVRKLVRREINRALVARDFE